MDFPVPGPELLGTRLRHLIDLLDAEVAQMARQDLVALAPGEDARTRIVHLTPRAEALLPALEAEWDATAAAAARVSGPSSGG
ncbi:hypothetical protein [Streptosporangium pseudovulgare]|uniref:MarR family transcriptional regulator n=1 Tax=Streptosporangium pseudovulgare TaxID=35765 RepID=A0ABQ2QL84_9ACTN|nr:hypothetical protein [Streptosporangium pseudovulgare]GGP85705.1 hypothetical protein GCM10010140_13830 [Streptosporangium pseudovulgare]